jgi:hypothetical protein
MTNPLTSSALNGGVNKHIIIHPQLQTNHYALYTCTFMIPIDYLPVLNFISLKSQRKSPEQQFEGNMTTSSHNLLRVAHKASDHHLHHKQQQQAAMITQRLDQLGAGQVSGCRYAHTNPQKSGTELNTENARRIQPGRGQQSKDKRKRNDSFKDKLPPKIPIVLDHPQIKAALSACEVSLQESLVLARVLI